MLKTTSNSCYETSSYFEKVSNECDKYDKIISKLWNVFKLVLNCVNMTEKSLSSYFGKKQIK